MTFVGKILVVVIMVFALFFLAVSTVVFSTAKNWKDETAKLSKKHPGPEPEGQGGQRRGRGAQDRA